MDCKKIWEIIDRFAVIDWAITAVLLGLGIGLEYVMYSPDHQIYISTDIDSPIRSSTISYPNLCIITFLFGAICVLLIWFSKYGHHQMSRALCYYYFSIMSCVCCVLFLLSGI